VWRDWRKLLVIVRPETVGAWHRQGFRLYWTWISTKKRSGRPSVSPEVKGLIKRMAEANPFWGASRIHGELLKLGIRISERTVSPLMPRDRKPPSQTWKAFLHNPFTELVAMDFFTVPTARSRVLFVFVILAPHRRRAVHFNVTENPSAAWTDSKLVCCPS